MVTIGVPKDKGSMVPPPSLSLGKDSFSGGLDLPASIGKAFTLLVQQHASALMVQANPLFNSQPERLTTLAARHAVPTIYQFRGFPVAGGLMSYGSSLADAHLQGCTPPGKDL